MKFNIRERRASVAQYLTEKGKQTLELVAEATGMSKSSVDRHQKAIAQRNRYPESPLWETPSGSEWLKLLVYAVVYHFGIKQGVGAESISEFLQAVHLEGHVALSASTLRSLKQDLIEQIQAYGEEQKSRCKLPEGKRVRVGADETNFIAADIGSDGVGKWVFVGGSRKARAHLR